MKAYIQPNLSYLYLSIEQECRSGIFSSYDPSLKHYPIKTGSILVQDVKLIWSVTTTRIHNFTR